MNLLLLPGKSTRNQVWLPKVEQTMTPLFDTTRRFDLAHWENDNEEIALEAEVQKLAAEINGFEPYVVFAKSVGSIITCLATSDAVLTPKACLFAGFPLAMVQRLNLPVQSWLTEMDFPICVAQNDNDPLGGYDEVNRYFQTIGTANVTVSKLEGVTHDYEDLLGLKTLMTEVLT